MTTDTPPAQSVTWHGRTMLLHRPEPTQIAMWSRLARRFHRFVEDLGEDQTRALTEDEKSELLKLTERLATSILGVLADEKDKDWLEDASLSGEIGDRDLLELLNKCGDELQVAMPQDHKTAARVE